MKRLFFLFAFVLSAGFAVAQSAQTAVSVNQERAHAHAIRLQKNLALTEDQVVKIEAITVAKLDAIDAVNADASKTQEQKDTEITQIRNAKEKEVLEVLTPEQVTQYNQMKNQRQSRKEGSQE